MTKTGSRRHHRISALCCRDSHLSIFLLNQDYQELWTPSLKSMIYSWPPEYFLYSTFNSEFYQSKYQSDYFWTELTGDCFQWFSGFLFTVKISSRIYEIFSILLFRYDLLFSILISYSENHIRLFVDCVFSLTGSYIAILTFHTKYRQEYFRTQNWGPSALWNLISRVSFPNP